MRQDHLPKRAIRIARRLLVVCDNKLLDRAALTTADRAFCRPSLKPKEVVESAPSQIPRAAAAQPVQRPQRVGNYTRMMELSVLPRRLDPAGPYTRMMELSVLPRRLDPAGPYTRMMELSVLPRRLDPAGPYTRLHQVGVSTRAEESQEARGILYHSHANCSLCNSLQPLLISRSLSPRIAVLRYSLRTFNYYRNQVELNQQRQERISDVAQAMRGLRAAGLASINPRMGTTGSLTGLTGLRGEGGNNHWRSSTPWAHGGDWSSEAASHN
ncbi:unnamed protein product [Cladocopium goreaui]|uniref:Uncharacterized protein n=1 Tax=Cladocopium goreaui TaxID=2562237 RepID=A0A9P1GBT6_9DINO|nr:unnamed protein product [Cladocopium goreaui]